jgi:hypothetical protein
MNTILLVLISLASLPLLAGETLPHDFYETTVTLADLEHMKKSVGSGEAHWQNEKGFVIRCADKSCQVSCEPLPPEDAGEGEMIKDNKWCGIRLTPNHIEEFLKLIQKAGTEIGSQSDSLKTATCDSDGCVLRHQK